jgi:A/G-specific adenine glycosylase
MMDLGATVCTPRRPACLVCPLAGHCLAHRAGEPERFPLKSVKPDKPLRHGAAFVALRDDGAILLRKRAERGLLGGMSEVPTSAWDARRSGGTDVAAAPFAADWTAAGSVRHVFTHFELDLAVYRADMGAMPAPDAHWWSRDIPGEALPTVMKKVIEAASPGSTRRRAPFRDREHS